MKNTPDEPAFPVSTPDGATSDDEGNPDPAGYKIWMTDYPEEGSIPLDESLAGCPVKSAERGRAIAAFGASQSTAKLLPSINFDFERTESNGLVLVPKAEAVLRVRDAYEAGRASRAQSEPRESDQQLMRFYSVETLAALIDAQERHIVKLQAKLPPLRDEFQRTPRA